MISTNLPADLLAGSAFLAGMLQAIPTGSDVFTGIGQVGAVTILGIVARVLWVANREAMAEAKAERKEYLKILAEKEAESKSERAEYRKIIAEKDATIVSMATKATEAMVGQQGATLRLEKATDQVGEALDNVVANLAAISAVLPPPK